MQKDPLAPSKGCVRGLFYGVAVWIILLWLFFGCSTSHATDFYYFGINGKWIKNAKWGDVATGVVSSVATHFLGHMGYAYVKGLDVTVSGTKEILHEPYSDSEARNFARAGFVLQHGVGLVLTSCKRSRDWDFTKGYTITTALATITYPWRHSSDGDFNMIDDHGGNGCVEYLFFCALSCHEILRIEW